MNGNVLQGAKACFPACMRRPCLSLGRRNARFIFVRRRLTDLCMLRRGMCVEIVAEDTIYRPEAIAGEIHGFHF